MGRRVSTTKDVGLLHQLFKQNQLDLAAEFQRNAVWPRPAKAYLIDTILSDQPMPLFFLQRGRSAQTGRTTFAVVDGQQRLRAVLEFMDDRFRLVESTDTKWRGKKYSQLSPDLQQRILNYDLSVEELSDYTDQQIRDIFVRMNKFVVKLSRQELRHAREHGRFFSFVEHMGGMSFWRNQRVFTKHQVNRMRAVEFAAELTILLIEGPQDKKAAIDLYYRQYQNSFSHAAEITRLINSYTRWLVKALPNLSHSRFRKPTDLYSLIGALHEISVGGHRLNKLDPARAGAALLEFQKDLASSHPTRKASLYLAAASRQTDNLAPRLTRIRVLARLVKEA